MPDADGPAQPACAGCKRGDKVDAKRRCWRCCDRPCSACGRLTGSAFIELCISCGQHHAPEVRAPALPDAPGEEPGPARLWVAVLLAESGAVPTSVRVRQIAKYAKRRHGMRCVMLPYAVPEGVDVARLLEE